MNRYFLIFTLFHLQLFANSFDANKIIVPSSASYGDTSGIVAGCVCPISGSFMENFDFHAPGPEPLNYRMYYVSTMVEGWGTTTKSFVQIKLDPKSEKPTLIPHIRSSSGATYDLSGLYEGQSANLRIKESWQQKGQTNASGNELSAKSNPKNIRGRWDIGKHIESCYFKMDFPDGTEEIYNFAETLSPFLFSSFYVLHKVIHPSGNITQQDFYENGVIPSRLSLKSASGGKEFSYLSLHFNRYKNSPESHIWAVGAGKRTFVTQLYRFTFPGYYDMDYVTEAYFPDKPKVNYSYQQYPNIPIALMSRKSLPDGRYLEIDYYTNAEKNPGLVKQLKAPVGKGAESIVTQRFEYHRKEDQGHTDVFDAQNHKTTYAYSSERLTEISYYKGTETYLLSSKERNIWGAEHTPEVGNLLAKIFEDGEGNIHLAKDYVYDDIGNAVEKRTYGNISGRGCPLTYSNGKFHGGECFVEYAAFNRDRFNNKKTETVGNITTEYCYLPNTDLVTSKIIRTKDGYSRREFFEYNQHRILTKTIIDDGISDDPRNLEGLTFRKITKIKPRQADFCYGLPEIIEEHAYDPSTQKEVLLRKIYNASYSYEGQVEKQGVYDANNRLRYTIYKKYDAHGNLISETDPLGNTIVRDYDKNDNLIYEQSPRKDSYTECKYDYSNRLTEQTFFLNSGKTLRTSFAYDTLGNQISKTDHFGNTTYFHYDDFNRAVKIEYPPIQDENGSPVHTIEQYEYDCFGRKVSSTDGNGNTTRVSYNCFGKPVEILHPDGTRESYVYNLNGTLHSETTKNGTVIDYAYDDFLRVVSKITCSVDGTVLKKHSYTYNAFHKTSETDPEGNTTYYTYDIHGREKSVSRNGFITLYEYDSLGRISRTQEGDLRVIIFAYDLLDRKTEERIEDLQGNIYRQTNYVYDADGNMIEETSQTEQGPAVTYKEYDSLKQLVRVTDPLGNVSSTIFDYEFVNSLGQKVLCKTVIDPMYRKLITVSDALQRTVMVQRKNKEDQLTAQQEVFYDFAGNPILKKEHSILNGSVNKVVRNRWEYNCGNQIACLREAAGTPEEKFTSYEYNIFGQREKIIKPDGNSLCYEYDALGRMSSQYSTDGVFRYAYTYDRNDNVVAVRDLTQNTETHRKYDCLNLMIAETLANGLEIHYSRDAIGRVASILYPDGTYAAYTYDPTNLIQVDFENYIHKYAYHQSRLMQTELITKDQVHYTRDLEGRLKNISSHYWNESNLAYDPSGNLTYCTLEDLAGISNGVFTYDDLDQLASESGIFLHNYKHDSLNNRRAKDDDTYDVNHLNQLTQRRAVQYGYDPNGNLVRKEDNGIVTLYRYDILDRLLSVTTETNHVEYAYDAFNRRISRSENGEKIDYLYQGNLEIGAYNDGKALEKRILGQGLKGDIGGTIAIKTYDKIYAPIHDHNGNICALVDAESRSITQCYRYSAFGEEECYGDASSEPVSPWRFSSKRKDRGLIRFPFRDYDPEIGRWITPDPLGFNDGPNLYAYVHNNPLTHIDPYGLLRVRNRPCNPGPGRLIKQFSYRYGDVSQGSNRNQPGGNKISFDYRFYNGHFNKKFCPVTTIRGQDLSKRFDNKITDLRFGFTNGIYNDHKDCLHNGSYFSKMAYNSTVDVVHSPTNGLLGDLARCVDAKAYKITPQSLQLHQTWDRFFDNAKGKNPRYVQGCHSYGAIVTRNALMSYDSVRRKQISVIAVAPAAFIEKKYCRSVQHFVSTGDPVPRYDKQGMKKCLNTITFLEPHPKANRMFDHTFQSPTYAKPVIDKIESIIQEQKEEL